MSMAHGWKNIFILSICMILFMNGRINCLTQEDCSQMLIVNKNIWEEYGIFILQVPKNINDQKPSYSLINKNNPPEDPSKSIILTSNSSPSELALQDITLSTSSKLPLGDYYIQLQVTGQDPLNCPDLILTATSPTSSLIIGCGSKNCLSNNILLIDQTDPPYVFTFQSNTNTLNKVNTIQLGLTNMYIIQASSGSPIIIYDSNYTLVFAMKIEVYLMNPVTFPQVHFINNKDYTVKFTSTASIKKYYLPDDDKGTDIRMSYEFIYKTTSVGVKIMKLEFYEGNNEEDSTIQLPIVITVYETIDNMIEVTYGDCYVNEEDFVLAYTLPSDSPFTSENISKLLTPKVIENKAQNPTIENFLIDGDKFIIKKEVINTIQGDFKLSLFNTGAQYSFYQYEKVFIVTPVIIDNEIPITQPIIFKSLLCLPNQPKIKYVMDSNSIEQVLTCGETVIERTLSCPLPSDMILPGSYNIISLFLNKNIMITSSIIDVDFTITHPLEYTYGNDKPNIFTITTSAKYLILALIEKIIIAPKDNGQPKEALIKTSDNQSFPYFTISENKMTISLYLILIDKNDNYFLTLKDKNNQKELGSLFQLFSIVPSYEIVKQGTVISKDFPFELHFDFQEDVIKYKDLVYFGENTEPLKCEIKNETILSCSTNIRTTTAIGYKIRLDMTESSVYYSIYYYDSIQNETCLTKEVTGEYPLITFIVNRPVNDLSIEFTLNIEGTSVISIQGDTVIEPTKVIFTIEKLQPGDYRFKSIERGPTKESFKLLDENILLSMMLKKELSFADVNEIYYAQSDIMQVITFNMKSIGNMNDLVEIIMIAKDIPNQVYLTKDLCEFNDNEDKTFTIVKCSILIPMSFPSNQDLTLIFNNKCKSNHNQLTIKLMPNGLKAPMVNKIKLLLDEDTSVKMTFTNKIFSDPIIEFSQSTEVKLTINTSIITDSVLSFNIPFNGLSEGFYIISIKNEPNTIQTEPIICYMNDLILTPMNILAIKDALFSTIEFIFNANIIIGRISSIKYKKENDDTLMDDIGNNYAVVSPTIIRITHASLIFDILGKYEFYLSDITQDEPHKLTVKTNSMTILNSIFFIKESQEWKKSQIKFELPITDYGRMQTIANDITKEIYFTLTQETEALDKTLYEINYDINGNESKSNWGKFTGIAIMNNANTHKLLLKENEVIIVINEIPTLPLESKFNMKVIENSFKIIFTQMVFVEYLKKTLSIVDPCNIQSIDETKKQITVQCIFSPPLTIAEDQYQTLALILNSFDTKQDFTLYVTNCKEGEKEWSQPNLLCLCLAPKVLFKTQCYETCPVNELDGLYYDKERICVNCPLGNGLNDGNECKTDLSLKVGYETLCKLPNQIFDVVFNYKISMYEVDSFRLIESLDAIDNALVFNCIQDNDLKTFKCQDIDLSSLKVSTTYLIQWKPKHGEQVDFKGEGTVLIENCTGQLFELSSIKPSVIQLGINNENSQVELTYALKEPSPPEESDPIMLDPKAIVQLYDMENKSLVDSKYYTQTVPLNNIITLTIDKEMQIESVYQIKTIIISNQFTSDKTLLMYKNSMVIGKDNKVVFYKSDPFTIDILFENDVYLYRIEKVSYQIIRVPPSDQFIDLTKESYMIANDNPKKLIISQKDVQLDIAGEYLFKIKDLALSNAIEFIINVIPITYPIPNEITLSTNIFYYAIDSPSIPISFASDLMNYDIFSSIKDKDSKILFTLKPIEPLSQTVFDLHLNDPVQPSNWGRITSLLFFEYSNITNPIYTKEHNLVIIDDSTAPTKLITTLVYLLYDTKSFIVTYEQKIYPEYFTPIPYLIFNVSDCALKEETISDTNTNINIVCNNPLQATIIGKIEGFKVSNEIMINVCQKYHVWNDIQAPERQCVLCKDLNVDLPYFDNGVCISKCLMVSNDFICYSTCSEGNIDNKYDDNGICKTQCPEGKGYDITSKCIPLMITSISNDLFSNLTIKQSFDIKMNSVTAFPLEFSLQLKGQETLTPIIGCDYDKDLDVYRCITDSLNNLSAGSYTLYWKLNSIGYDVTLLDGTYFLMTIEKINPEIVNRKEVNTFTITYKVSFNKDYKIGLYNQDTNTVFSIDSGSITIDPNDSKIIQVNLPLDNSVIDGSYTIQTILGNISSRSELSLLIYDGNDLQIDPITESVIIAGISKANFTLHFTSVLFKSRINTVTYTLPQTQAIIVLLYSVTDKIITIRDTIQFYTIGEYTFTIVDNANKKSLLYIIKTVGPNDAYPKFASLSSSVFYSSNPSSFIDITFEPYILDIALISSIRVNKRNTFSLESYITNNMKKIKMLLLNPDSSDNWGRYDSIELYAYYGLSERFLFEIKTPLIIVNYSTLPRTLIKEEIILKSGQLTFDIEFKEHVYEEYKNENRIQLPDCKGIGYNKETMNINAQECTVNSEGMISIISFDYASIPLKITTMECNADEIFTSNRQCAKCTTFIYNNICYTQCPSGKIEEGNHCYDSCRSVQDKPYSDGSKCLNQCLNYTDKETMQCYNICPKKINGIAVYVDTKNNQCLRKCPDSYVTDIDNTCISKDNLQCINSNIDVICIQSCPIGTILENGSCVYKAPSDKEEICEIGYCGTNGQCQIQLKKKVCACNKGFYGTKCEIDLTSSGNELNDLQSQSKILFNNFFNPNEKEIDISHLKSIESVISLSSIINQNNQAIDSIENQELLQMMSLLEQTISVSITKNFKEELIPFSSFCLFASIIKTQGTSNTRLLQENSLSNSIQSLTDKVLSTLLLIPQANGFYPTSQYIADQSNIFHTLIWTNHPDSMISAKRIAEAHNITWFNYTSLTGLPLNYSIIQTEFSPDYTNTLRQSNNGSMLIRTTIYDYAKKIEINLPSTNFYSVIERPVLSTMNQTSYFFYLERGIDIYNKSENAYNENCYYNKKLDYDLTQKYRKTILYQGKVIDTTPNCIYEGADIVNRNILLNCSFSQNEIYGYHLTNTNLSNVDQIDNLPTKCASKIEGIVNNFAFWIYLLGISLVIIAMIAMFIITTTSSPDYRILNWLANDDISSNYVMQNRENVYIYNDQHVTLEQLKLVIQTNPSFTTILCKNFNQFHSLLSLWGESVLNPPYFKVGLFGFNLFNLFGFNALYYSETMIEKKIMDEYRDNFAYPIRSECEKIIAAIVTTMALTMITRAFVFVTQKDKDDLSCKCSRTPKLDLKYLACQEFWKKGLIRRLIAYAFMLFWVIFFFYYTVVFCGIYVMTQYSWFYSGIWSIILNWVIFCPLSIVIISAIEMNYAECTGIIKQIFWF